VRPFWHPLSTILLFEPPCFATDALVRMLLDTEQQVKLVYAGDRMWPSLHHGASFTVRPPGDGIPAVGTVVLVSRAGIPDLLRVSATHDDALSLTADAEPGSTLSLPPDAVLGHTRLPSLAPSERRATFRRLVLDLREAWRGRPDPGLHPTGTVREKYEMQAALYAHAGGADIDPRLLERLRDRIPGGGGVLVVGSGSGRECFALAEDGWRVLGVEFSPTMVALSVAEARRRELDIDFRQTDIRELALEGRQLAGVLFTYDVFSFLPRRRERIDLLRRLRSWLRPDGAVFLSARRLRSLYDRLILTLQWLALQRKCGAEWGDSHTRWIPHDGALRRSFVHVFSPRQLRAEIASADLRAGPWKGGHCVLDLE
jgi:SAM-dependent methyltransferase